MGSDREAAALLKSDVPVNGGPPTLPPLPEAAEPEQVKPAEAGRRTRSPLGVDLRGQWRRASTHGALALFLDVTQLPRRPTQRPCVVSVRRTDVAVRLFHSQTVAPALTVKSTTMRSPGCGWHGWRWNLFRPRRQHSHTCGWRHSLCFPRRQAVRFSWPRGSFAVSAVITATTVLWAKLRRIVGRVEIHDLGTAIAIEIGNSGPNRAEVDSMSPPGITAGWLRRRGRPAPGWAAMVAWLQATRPSSACRTARSAQAPGR